MLDTNLFVAAFWNKESASFKILEACRKDEIHHYYTQEAIKEIFIILRNIKVPESYKDEVWDVINHGSEVEISGKLSVITSDPADNKFLECAQIAEADYVITNDDHLLVVGKYEGIEMIKPSAFLQKIAHLSLSGE